MAWFDGFAILNTLLFVATATAFGCITPTRKPAFYFPEPLLASVIAFVAGRELFAVLDPPAHIAITLFRVTLTTFALTVVCLTCVSPSDV
jgi:hypothetical protein